MWGLIRRHTLRPARMDGCMKAAGRRAGFVHTLVEQMMVYGV